MNTIRLDFPTFTLYYSYTTLVAFQTLNKVYVRENVFSTTTSKHLNWIDGGDVTGKKKDRLNEEDFEKAYQENIGGNINWGY